ncbi:MAG: NPCBM/NEW2 domain-containing protein [Opitutales bacterium]
MVLLAVLTLACTPRVHAGYLFTLTEEFYSGKIELRADRLVVRDASGATIGETSLNRLWFADLRNPDTEFDPGGFTPLAPFAQDRFHGQGVLLANGTFLSGQVLEFSDDAVAIRDTSGQRRQLDRPSVARVNFNPTLLGNTPVVPNGTTGVLLSDGNYVEGDFQGVQEEHAVVHSIIFGPKRYALRHTHGVVLQDYATASSQWIVATHDGSQYLTNNLDLLGSTVRLDDLALGDLTLQSEEIAFIKAGRARAESLTELPYVRRAPALNAASDLSLRSSPVTAAPLIVDPASHTVTMPAGNAMAVRLNRQAWGFAARLGVPENVSPLQAVRFRVLADRKVLYESQPRSVDDGEEIVVVRTPIRDFIVLEVLPVDAQTNEAPGLWIEPVLLRN